MYLPGPGFDGPPDSGTARPRTGFRTFIHENGHLGLGAYDEYYRAGGSATCTSDRYAHPETHRASIMAYQYDATELCSDLNHNPATTHGEVTGQSVWGTVAYNWTGPWILRTPMLSGTVNPGPTTLSCFANMTPRVVSVPRPSCSPLRLRATSGGTPVTRHPVDLQHRGRTIAQGQTDDLGELLIHGGEAGDRVTLRPYATSSFDRCFWDAEAVVQQSCGPLDLEANWRCEPVVWDRLFPIILWMHEGDPPLVDVRIPAQQGGLPLQVFIAQDGADEEPVTLAYDQAAGAYVGSLPFDAKRAAEFALRFVGVDGKGKPVETTSRLHGARFHPGGANMQELFASDGDVTLSRRQPRACLTAPASCGPTRCSRWRRPSERVVGAPSVTVEGEVALAQPLILSLRFDPSAVKKGTERALPDGGRVLEGDRRRLPPRDRARQRVDRLVGDVRGLRGASRRPRRVTPVTRRAPCDRRPRMDFYVSSIVRRSSVFVAKEERQPCRTCSSEGQRGWWASAPDGGGSRRRSEERGVGHGAAAPAPGLEPLCTTRLHRSR